jgi:hypothetical protein
MDNVNSFISFLHEDIQRLECVGDVEPWFVYTFSITISLIIFNFSFIIFAIIIYIAIYHPYCSFSLSTIFIRYIIVILSFSHVLMVTYIRFCDFLTICKSIVVLVSFFQISVVVTFKILVAVTFKNLVADIFKNPVALPFFG